MHKTITPLEMKRVEKRAMRETPVTGEALMRRAAGHVADAVRRYGATCVLCLCGTGNNGGDGLLAMQLLAREDARFTGECWVLPGELSPDAQRELNGLVQAAGKRVRVRRLSPGERPSAPRNVRCVIDALFGTGLSRPLAGDALALCGVANALGNADIPVVAVDIPSGLNGETGQVMGAAVFATETITFHRAKPGLYLGEGPEYAGRVTIASIGLEPSMDDADGMRVLERGDLRALLPARRRVSHKGSYGSVLLWAGSRGMAGAAAISALAALRAGAGLVRVACPENVVDIVQTLCPCATCVPLPVDDAEGAWARLERALQAADALGAGCGLGQGEATQALLERLLGWLSTHALPAVLDADALNLLSKRPAYLCGGVRVITPHPAEAARLLGETTSAITADAPAAAKRLRKRYGAAVVLKGAVSVLCAGENMALNPFGTPAMAKGGSGDALTGVLAALLAGRVAGAYQMEDLMLLQAACALHGLAGEQAEAQFGQRGVLATDLCACFGMDFFAGARVTQSEPQTRAATDAQYMPDAPDAPARPLGCPVTVTVEHRAGSRDEQRPDFIYTRNVGYAQEVLDRENGWQDVCVLGEGKPLEWFEGVVVARVFTSAGEIWAAAPKEMRPTVETVRREMAFLGELGAVEVL